MINLFQFLIYSREKYEQKDHDCLEVIHCSIEYSAMLYRLFMHKCGGGIEELNKLILPIWVTEMLVIVNYIVKIIQDLKVRNEYCMFIQCYNEALFNKCMQGLLSL